MTSESYQVRAPTQAEMAQVASLAAMMVRMHPTWDPRFARFDEPIEPGYERWLSREAQNREALVLAAVCISDSDASPRVLGYAYARLEGRDWNALRDACAVLHDLVVREDRRGQGMGGALLAAVAAWAKERGAPRLLLNTAAANSPGQAFFRKHGFRPTMIEMTREVGD